MTFKASRTITAVLCAACLIGSFPTFGVTRTIDVLVVFLNGSQTHPSLSTTGLTTNQLAQWAVDQLNLAMINSDLEPVSWYDPYRNQLVFRGVGAALHNNPSLRTTSDVVRNADDDSTLFNVVKSRRADLTIVILPNITSENACGRATLAWSLRDSFSAVYSDCFFTTNTAVHEVGHQFGAGHDEYATILPSGSINIQSKGYILPSLSGSILTCFKTVMTYRRGYSSYSFNGRPCTIDVEQLVFSNPFRSFGNREVGDWLHYNAATIQTRARLVSEFTK